MKKKHIFIFTLIILSIYLFFNTGIFYTLRSYIVMYPYSIKHKDKSLLKRKNIKLSIPGGSLMKKDWYPFTMTFTDDEGFSKYVGRDLALTILYNFGHFDKLNGSSTYFNPSSPYFSSFYGAYIVYDNENPNNRFGFKNLNEVNVKELMLIPKYDQTRLVLPSLGCPYNKTVFKVKIGNIKGNINYIGLDGWTRIDATIVTNSPIHKYKKGQRGYIQFGRPLKEYYNGVDFPLINLKGRVYAKYFNKYKMTFIFYVMGKDLNLIENCDKNILSKSRIIVN
ncbi:hypothetical protein [Thermohalobacter berrensis]|uniref:Uncharacterized protein n=1 Tax=Thermohalobacter berrensis TaxID=99594 RepID=A0A419T8X2_9FIRM|nr:hypothetical protein [Thermohalobacter berrensis]RKD33931.1 hypothetical protein BET03_08365 [Thermohalobacter berrensis]